MFKVQATYPDGHNEVIDMDFDTQEKAIDYGMSLLIAIPYNERMRGDSKPVGLAKKKKASFIVFETGNGRERVVYDSKKA